MKDENMSNEHGKSKVVETTLASDLVMRLDGCLAAFWLACICAMVCVVVCAAVKMNLRITWDNPKPEVKNVTDNR
jgi:hypothetical protein